MNTIIERLRDLARAYPSDVFSDVSEAEAKKYGSLLTRNSAAMGRHFAPLFLEAADEIERLTKALGESGGRNVDIINRRVVVEQFLLDAANGKREPPTVEECRALAEKLGSPREEDDTP